MSLPVLPQELLVEILSWVPVKDLMRFRCVSKSWNSLVFDPTFVKLHLQRSSKNTHVLVTFDDEDNKDESSYLAACCSVHALLENPSSTIDSCCQFNHDYLVLGVCNGLVCLQGSYIGDGFEEHWFRFWNPATRVMSEDSPVFKIGGLLRFGFGYDDWSDTYKVVVIFEDTKSKKVEVRVHGMGDTCWRNVLTFPVFPIPEGNGAFVSGTLNWLAAHPDVSSYQGETLAMNKLVIFSYDLKNGTYRFLSTPDDLSIPDGLFEVRSVPVLEVLKGCLCLSHRHRKTHFGFWIMREFGVEESWTHLLNISYEQLHIHKGFLLIPVILCLSENDEVMLLTNEERAEFILYNKRENKVDRREDFNGKFSFLSYDYVQSLVLPYRN